MTQKAVPFNELVEGVLDQLKTMEYSESSLEKYRRLYTRLSEFLVKCGTDVYTPEIGKKFLAYKNVKKPVHPSDVCIIRRLDDFIHEKPFKLHYENPHMQVPEEFMYTLDGFLHECLGNGNNAATLHKKEATCVMFLDFLKKNGCTDLSQMSIELISRALLIFSNKDRYATISQFLKFLALKNITETNLSGIVPHYRRPKPLPTTYTPEEILRVEAVIDTSTDTGKRNIAIIRLATRMALRAGDIARLQLTEVDLNTGYINIIQKKTGVPISLQMPSDVREALEAHIENDARSSADGYVFHCQKAPYRRISTGAISRAVNDGFIAAKVDTTGKKHGPHAFRSSLASSMVNDGASYEVVRRILGHSDPNVIKYYAKADIENLRKCAIEPPAPIGRFSDYLSGKEVISHV